MTSGLASLVPAAQLLAAVAGGRDQALQLASEMVGDGSRVIRQVDDDLHGALRAALIENGVIKDTGAPVPGRCGELIAVCEVLAAQEHPVADVDSEGRLVFSAPRELVPLAATERLDSLVLDLVRMATDSLVIGGPFWNEAGFELLSEVIGPAVAVRGVRTTFIVHPSERDVDRNRLRAWLGDLATTGDVTARWYRPAPHTLMHAKFIVADGCRGYLGTANLTSWGLASHIEAGVQLLPHQCEELLSFLDRLERARAFSDQPA